MTVERPLSMIVAGGGTAGHIEGISNKIGARVAARVLAAAADSGVHGRGLADAEVVGIPVRSAITSLNRPAPRAHFGLPAFSVPLPHGNGERELNARPVVDAGGGRIVADAELTPKYVIDEVIPLLRDTDRLTTMGRAAADAGYRDAADEVARIVLEVAGR